MLLKRKRILNPLIWSVLEFQLEIRTHMTLDTEGNVQILTCKLQKAGIAYVKLEKLNLFKCTNNATSCLTNGGQVNLWQ